MTSQARGLMDVYECECVCVYTMLVVVRIRALVKLQGTYRTLGYCVCVKTGKVERPLK